MAKGDPAGFSVWVRLRSFRYAFAGLFFLLRTQHNAWLHGVATLVVASAGVALGLSAGEWCWVVAAVAALWIAEAFNTSIESLCDVVSPEIHEGIKAAKDLAAAAVLIAAVAAAVIGLFIFAPHIWLLLSARH